MGFSAIDALDKQVLRGRFRGPSELHLYPSEASVKFTDAEGREVIKGKCMRAAYFRCVGEEGRPRGAGLAWKGEVGKVVEEMLMEKFKVAGLYVANSVRFNNPEYKLSGEIDGVVIDPTTSKLIGLEIKSFYGYHAAKGILGNKSTKGQPKDTHLLQTLVYAKEFSRDLDHFKMIYFERGDGQRREFNIRIVSDELDDGTIVTYPEIDGTLIQDFTIEDIYARYKELLERLKKEDVPPKEFELKYSDEKVEEEYLAGRLSKSKYEKFRKVSKAGEVKLVEKDRPGDWQCAWCDYKSICYK